jgi:hypothetical protein
MKNTLAPLKNSTNTNFTSQPSSDLHTELSHAPKLDAIPPGKREEKPKTDDRPQSPTPDQRHHPKIDERPQSPAPDQRHHPKIEDRPQSPAADQQNHPKIEERPQSPTPDQQQQRKTEDQQHVEEEESKSKDLLKGKPIIFVGGGPGMRETI